MTGHDMTVLLKGGGVGETIRGAKPQGVGVAAPLGHVILNPTVIAIIDLIFDPDRHWLSCASTAIRFFCASPLL